MAATEYERLTGDLRLGSLVRSPTSDGAWQDALGASPSVGFLPTTGAPYLQSNLECLSDSVAVGTHSPTDSGEVVWLRPGGSAWGRTFRIPEALQTLRDSLRNAGVAEQHTALLMPRSTHKTLRKLHRRVFDRATLLPQSHLPSNLEILLVGRACAFVGVHVAVDGSPVAMGGIVTDPVRLEKIAARLTPSASGAWDELWAQEIGQAVRRQDRTGARPEA
jgi:hypothetical protein